MPVSRRSRYDELIFATLNRMRKIGYRPGGVFRCYGTRAIHVVFRRLWFDRLWFNLQQLRLDS